MNKHINIRLREARKACKWRAYEIAEKLGMSAVRYMSIEIEWEEPSEREVHQICNLFGASPKALGFGSKFSFSLEFSSSGEVQSNAILLEKGTVMQLKLW